MAQIYKATYSGVPVYEFNCNNVAVMRRRSDSYLNATQILKVAEFDKPQRTRILEREVQTGQHEKVQGGYGKYQGTWVPFERGVALAEHYHVDAILRPIFDYVKGDVSPPLAPKHVTAASSRPRKPRNTEPKRKKVIVKRMLTEEDMDVDMDYHHDFNNTAFTDQFFADNLQKNKRTRPLEDFAGQDMEMAHDGSYAQKLLQYFISDDNGIPAILLRPPADLDVNVIIDDEGHTSLHWAAAMGRLKLVNILIDLGADIYRVNYKGQTALMRSVLFTNNFDAKSFLFLIDMLKKTIFNIDKKDQTVFHHVAATASWKGKVHASRYYMECLIETLASNQSELISILNVQDVYGDTALSIAARIGNKKLVRLLIDAGASAEIANEEGMTAQDYLSEVERNNRFQPLAQSASSTTDDIYQRNDHRVELAARTKLRHTVEGLFKKILVADRSQPPIVSQVFDGLAGNYERDLIQKDHLIKEKKNDLELAKKRLAGTEHTFEQIQYDPTRLQIVEHASQKLSKLLVKQTLVIQKELIDSLISEYKQEAPVENKDNADPAALLAELKQLQQDRKKHTETLMQLLMKTPSKRHQEYKRLISMCCNVSYENVDLMLLPLLSSFNELDASTEAAVDPSMGQSVNQDETRSKGKEREQSLPQP
ncbi:apses-domain-containing protein [Mucor ambiguus]|uniref:Apses-domain-containing protein n=1 Tax=Mucor ambiguus TaxID=91626 RepID=A0A0C9M8T3_9FUNG|nr:apses-domain-containing protein [Mucor ambiguus]